MFVQKDYNIIDYNKNSLLIFKYDYKKYTKKKHRRLINESLTIHE